MRRLLLWMAWLLCLGAGPATGQAPSQSQLLQDGLRQLEARGDARAALARFEQAARGPDRVVSARARLYVGVAAERIGEERARLEYERVLREFPDQTDVAAEARRRLAALTVRLGSRPLSISLRRAMPRLPRDVALLGGISTDGRRFGFIGDDGRVSLGDAITGTAITVTSRPMAGAPAWDVAPAPDGRRVAVAREQQDRTATVTIEGMGAATLLFRSEAGATIGPLEWPLPGTVLSHVFNEDGMARVLLLDVARRAVRTSVAIDPLTRRASLSPDARWLVFERPVTTPARDEVVVADVSTGATTTLVTDASLPIWTPDGRHVLFLSGRTGSTGLWAQAVTAGRAAGEPSLVEQDLGRVFDVLGATTDTYHYVRQVGLVDVYTVGLTADGRVSGSPRGAATTFVGSNMGPAFSPDGRTLVFLAQIGFSSREALGFREVESGEYRVMPTAMRYLRSPCWSPDGKRIMAKGSDGEGRFGFHVVDPGTGAVTPIVTVPHQEETTVGVARWSHDGAAIVYSRFHGTTLVISRRDLDTGDERTVLELAEGAVLGGQFDVSASGALLYFERTTSGGIVVVRDPDGVRHEALRFGERDRVIGASFWPDGRRILLERPGTAPPADDGAPAIALWSLDEWGGVPRPLGVEMAGLRRATISPDGRRLAFTAGAPLREPWVLEHFQSRLPPASAARGAVR